MICAPSCARWIKAQIIFISSTTDKSVANRWKNAIC
ncbi:Uncharacterised protein [Vibrio cholerae]|nr:Uncharacterised protein [Vibrio cholerae]